MSLISLIAILAGCLVLVAIILWSRTLIQSAETNTNTDLASTVDTRMAYAEYTKAAALLNQALDEGPQRMDYIFKLFEVYFIAGNENAFVETAIKFRRQIPGEKWEQVKTMGRQIAQDERLFE